MAKKPKKDLRRFDPAEGLTGDNRKLPLMEVAAKVAPKLGRRFVANPKNSPPIVKIEGAKYVPINKIWVNYTPGFQRPPMPDHIENNIIAKWDPYAATSLHCRYDPVEDRYYIADGQHHAIAWAIVHGKNTKIPLNAIVSTDPKIELKMFYYINTSGKRPTDHELHLNKVEWGDPEAVAIENAIQAAGCSTANKGTKTAYVITNVDNLYKCFNMYGSWSQAANRITNGLKRYKVHFPNEPIDMGTFWAMMKIERMLKSSKSYSVRRMEEIWTTCALYFSAGNKLSRECKRVVDASTKRLGLPRITDDIYKVSSGIISLYNAEYGTNLLTKLWNDLNVPVMRYDLHGEFDKNTYKTIEMWERVCETGDIAWPWAYAASQRPDVEATVKQLYEICGETCANPNCTNELDYSLGENTEGVKAPENSPEVDHIIPRSDPSSTNDISNLQIYCEPCNMNKSNSTEKDKFRIIGIADSLERV